MNEIFKFATSICILMIIASVVGALTQNFRNGRLVRSATSVMIIIVTLNFILTIDFTSSDIFTPNNYVVDSSMVWDSTLESVASQLEGEMKSLCVQNGLNVDEIKVKLKTNYKDIQVDSVTISGADTQSAKNLIAGYFKIGLAYININGE